jgi:hypothetical protein
MLKSSEEMWEFLPSEAAIRQMHTKYPKHSTFIMDAMMGPKSQAGWFLAGFLFGIDPELRVHFQESHNYISEGKMREKYDA